MIVSRPFANEGRREEAPQRKWIITFIASQEKKIITPVLSIHPAYIIVETWCVCVGVSIYRNII
jgi:hypothetical protein